MASADEGDNALITGINVMPLVDIVLVLLVVFMITMPTITRTDALRERELEVDLPQVRGGRPLKMPPRQIVISVDREGRDSIGDRNQTEAEMAEILRLAAVADAGNVNVAIRADKHCDWLYVGAVMSRCKQVNIRTYRMSVTE
jgi:biopolymer transport protein ExbD